MKLEVVDKNIKRSSSFFRLSDKSWCEIATRWGKGPRTGLIVCKGNEKAIPNLADLLIEEAKRRKYKTLDTYPKVIVGDDKYDFTKKVLSEIKEKDLIG